MLGDVGPFGGFLTPLGNTSRQQLDNAATIQVSGLLDGGTDIAQRPVVVDVPVGKGHVVLFANNPIYRWQTFGEHQMVFNALLYWNDIPANGAGAKPTPSP